MHLFTASTISALQRAIESDGPKANDWATLIARVDAWCAAQVALPNQSGGWIHNYISPINWLPLIYDGDRPNDHRCPVGHSYTGDAYDEAWLAWRHRQIADMSREVALAYVVTGEARYLAEVERVLLHYAAFYANFVGADSAESWMITARVFNQALTEALWAIPLIHAFDLVSADLDPAIRQQIADDFLQPLGETMAQSQDALIEKDNVRSNYMAWFNAALGGVGYAIGNGEFVERAIDGAGGFIEHLTAGVFADGMQYEVTPYYHNFVVLAYQILAEAAAANGRDLYEVRGRDGQSITDMWRALTQFNLPDGTIADVGDGSYWIDSVYDRELIEVYEIAYARDLFFSSCATTLAHAYARLKRGRDSWAALLYGVDSLDQLPTTNPQNLQLLPDAGVAVLNASPHLAAATLFGAYRDSHSHGDQLSMQVWPFSNDAGCVLYGIPARREWYQDSYAHNTLVVNQQSQTTFSQAIHQANGSEICLKAVDAFPNVSVTRKVAIHAGALVDVLTASAESEQLYDFVFHVDGSLTVEAASVEPMDERAGSSVAAQQIELTKKIAGVDSAEFTILYNNQTFALVLAGNEPFDVLIGTAPGTSWDPTQRRHVIIGRTQAKTQQYQTTIKHIS